MSRQKIASPQFFYVVRVHSWHGKGRSRVKHSTIHERYLSQADAFSACSRLNSGHGKQSYWVTDFKGKVIPRTS